MTERRFKTGDEVYLASAGGRQFGLIKKVNLQAGFAVIYFEGRDISVSMERDLYLASEVDRQALPKSQYEKMLDERSVIFRPGVAIMNCNYGYGMVIEVTSNGLACVDFKFYGRKYIERQSFDSWLAEEKDKDWYPRSPEPEPEPEPLCELQEATLENLEESVCCWERVPGHMVLPHAT